MNQSIGKILLMKIFICVSFLFSTVLSVIEAQESNIYPFDYSPRYQLKTYLAPTFSNLNSDNYKSKNSSMGFCAGADLIFYLVNTGRLKPAVSLGLNISTYNSSYNLNYNDSLWTIDPGNDRVHVYEQGEINEKQQAVFVSIPLQLHLDYSLSKRIGGYVSTGYFFSLISSGNYISDVLLSRQGYYPRYNVLIYDVDVEGSQYFYPSDKSMSATESLHLRSNDGIIFSTGLRCRLTPVYSFSIGLKGLVGQKNISGYSSDVGFLMVSNQHTLNTTMAMNEIVKTSSWGVEFGLTMNLGKNKTQNIFQILQRIRYSIQKR